MSDLIWLLLILWWVTVIFIGWAYFYKIVNENICNRDKK
jgi:hypothetical protein